jgi:hypothetical protein
LPVADLEASMSFATAIVSVLFALSSFLAQSSSALFQRPEELTTFTSDANVFNEENLMQPTPMNAIGGHCG